MILATSHLVDLGYSMAGPASVDLTLGEHFWGPKDSINPSTIVDIGEPANPSMYHESLGTVYLPPGGFCLGHTEEYVRIPIKHVGRVDGRSSCGRHGVSVHATAGFIDPGFEGQITLEIINHNRWTVKLTPGLRICQMSIHTLEGCATGYTEGYQWQVGATLSKGLR